MTTAQPTDEELLLEEQFAQKRLTAATAWRLLGYLGRYRWMMLATLTLEILWVSSMLLGPHLVKVAIDDGILADAWSVVLIAAGLYVLSSAVRLTVVIVQIRIAARTGMRVLADLRRDLFAHIQRLSISYFDRTKEGRIIARVDRDVDSLEQIIVWGPLELLSCVLALALVIPQMAYYDWRLCAAVASLVPLLLLVGELVRRRGAAAFRHVKETSSRVTGRLAESFAGVRVAQAFVREADERRALAELHREHDEAVDRAALIWSAYLPFTGLVYVAAVAIILGYGGTLAAAGEVGLGELAAFVLLLGMFFGPLEYLGALYHQSLSAQTAAERIFLLLDTPPQVTDAPSAPALPRLDGTIRFESVDFAYDNGRQVLHGVDFSLAAGQTLALVGHTGAGKSTLVNLLARFYEPTGGRVLIDGHDICDHRQDSLRQQLALVPQDGFLFCGTVLDNLRVGKPEACDEELIAGARALGIEHLLAALPDGFATDVGERGDNLSHGQRQLIALTRALLADPRLLILDEATSAVDTPTERLIQAAIEQLRAGRTTIIVAHRLSTIVSADRIAVLADGQLVEFGSHAQLVRSQGRYARMYQEHVGA